MVIESKSRSLSLENERLTGETALLKEQNKRLWRRMGAGQQSSQKKQSSGSDGH